MRQTDWLGIPLEDYFSKLESGACVHRFYPHGEGEAHLFMVRLLYQVEDTYDWLLETRKASGLGISPHGIVHRRRRALPWTLDSVYQGFERQQ